MNDRRMSKNYCTYCQNVVEGVRIRCAECPDIDLCLPCFTCGAEFGNHKRDHGYIVLDNLDFHIYGEIINWTAGEELLLLDSVEQYGFGNWNDISSHVETKNSEECKNHYIALYIHGNIGKVTFPITSTVRIKDHTFTETYSSSSQPLPPAELTLQEQHELGYMPYRDDFERDYDNFAEVDISSLALHRDDDDIDTAFKLAQVDEYRQRLKERQRRKNIAREHGLLSQFFLNRQQPVKVTKKKAVKDERDLQQRLNVFAQVLSRTEKETFFEGLDKERYLKQKIKELQKYRRNGITKLEDCLEYDEEKNVRDKKKDTKKKMISMGTTKRTSMVSKKAAGEENANSSSQRGNTSPKSDLQLVHDPSTLPGFELLSDSERKLCSSIGMKPASYITVKTCILKDFLQRRQGMPVKVRYPSGLDKSHRLRIISFLSDAGWIGAA